MNECHNCHIKIANNEMVCPLCHTVLKKEEGNAVEVQQENMYPDVSFSAKTFYLATRIFILSALILEIVLIIINVLVQPQIGWSLICGVGFLCAYVTLKNMLSENSGHIMKLFIETITAIFLAIMIDTILGFSGWSINFAIPVTIMTVDASIVVLMIVNNKNWQSYLLLQIFMVTLSVIMLFLIKIDIVTAPFLTLLAAVVSVLVFFGTFMIGENKAVLEIKRRFHV